MHDTRIALYQSVKEKSVIFFNISLSTSQFWLFAISSMGHIWDGPWCENGLPRGPELFSTFRGHIDLHPRVREKNVIYFDIGHLSCHV